MMAGAPGYVTVKEYAERRGVSLQAVYKQIRAGRLEYTEITEAGRAIKYIKAEQTAEDPAQPPQEAEATENSAPPAADPVRVALDLLGEQLREKDKQIERLQAEIKEKDSHIQEQAEKLTELLRRSQDLQAHAQHLLEPHENPQPEAETVIEAQATDLIPEGQPKKRRGFLAWLFGE